MTLLDIRNVSKTFFTERSLFRNRTGALRAVSNVSLTLKKGKVLGIVGESGSGKSTLGKMVCRLLQPDEGDVLIEGKNIAAYSRRDLSRKVQMVFQDPYASLNPKLPLRIILQEAAYHLTGRQRSQAISDILSLVGLSDKVLSAYPHQFSGGQRQRIALARALLQGGVELDRARVLAQSALPLLERRGFVYSRERELLAKALREHAAGASSDTVGRASP